jgi:hypothetical protein
MMAQVACFYRLHIVAIEQLVNHSYQIACLSKMIEDRATAVTIISHWLREVRLDLQRRDERDLSQ